MWRKMYSQTLFRGEEPISAGQATVEFVLVMPFFILMLLAVVQIGLLTRSKVLVAHAAREAVRVAAVGGHYGDVRAAAVASSDLAPEYLSVDLEHGYQQVTVNVHYIDRTNVPVVGRMVSDAVFSAQATMRVE